MSYRLLSYVSGYVVYQSPESSRRDSHQFHFCMSERACHRDYWSCIPTTAGSLSLEWRSVHVTTLTMPIVFRTWNPCYLRRYTASHLPVLCSLPSLVKAQCPIPSLSLWDPAFCNVPSLQLLCAKMNPKHSGSLAFVRPTLRQIPCFVLAKHLLLPCPFVFHLGQLLDDFS